MVKLSIFMSYSIFQTVYGQDEQETIIQNDFYIQNPKSHKEIMQSKFEETFESSKISNKIAHNNPKEKCNYKASRTESNKQFICYF